MNYAAIRLGAQVRLEDLRPQTVMALMITQGVFTRFSISELLISSVDDRTHTEGSIHPVGLAFDIDTKVLRPHALNLVALTSALKNALGEEFDVILEDKGRENEHIHVEWDPSYRKALNLKDSGVQSTK